MEDAIKKFLISLAKKLGIPVTLADLFILSQRGDDFIGTAVFIVFVVVSLEIWAFKMSVEWDEGSITAIKAEKIDSNKG